MSLFPTISPCVKRHGTSAYKAAILQIGGSFASVKLEGQMETLFQDALDDVVVPFSRWFNGGASSLLAACSERAPLAFNIASGVTRANGLVDDLLLANVAFLASFNSVSPGDYCSVVYDKNISPASSPTELIFRAAVLNAMDLACGNKNAVIERLDSVSDILSLPETENIPLPNLFALQECCALNSEWPSAGMRVIQEQLNEKRPSSTHDGYSSAWRICIYQAALILAKNYTSPHLD